MAKIEDIPQETLQQLHLDPSKKAELANLMYQEEMVFQGWLELAPEHHLKLTTAIGDILGEDLFLKLYS